MTNIRNYINNAPARSAWDKGVKVYALELLDGIEEGINGGYYSAYDLYSPSMLEYMALNGASDWHAYSWGGCSLCYDADIARRLCAPYELRRTDNGNRRPNKREEWLDVQARALHQAFSLLREAVNATREEV